MSGGSGDKMRTDDWYTRAFDTREWLEGVALRIPQDQTDREVDFLERELGLADSMHILDVACGHGRHCLELQRRGFEVTGLDLSEPSLRVATGSSGATRARCHFVRGDMRRLPFGAVFHAAVNLFSSFGYLESAEEDQRVLAEVHRCLLPGGVFVLDVLNLLWLERNRCEIRKRRLDNDIQLVTRREFSSIDHTVLSSWGFVGPRESRAVLVPLRVYGPTELTGMLEDAGFTVERLMGDFRGARYSKITSRLIILSRKRE